MTEFTEVIKQRNRICEHYTKSGTQPCQGVFCPLHGKEWVCDFTWYNKDVSLDELDNRVMSWAKEHPEPVYPTWEEWQNSMFPNANVRILPCWFVPKNPAACNTLANCSECRGRPIPAEIAEKLGIKSKEEA